MWGDKQDLHYKYPKPCSVGSKVFQGQDRGLTFRHPVDADDSFRMVSTLPGLSPRDLGYLRYQRSLRRAVEGASGL